MAPTLSNQGSDIASTTENESPWGKVITTIISLGNLFTLVVMAYASSSLLIRTRQRKANEKAEFEEYVNEDKRKTLVRQKAWAKFARKDPLEFIKKVILKKRPGSSERRMAITFLYIANPEWARINRDKLINIEYRNITNIEFQNVTNVTKI